MRKYLYYWGILIALLLTLNGCEKEMMDYEGEDALYFDIRSSIGAHEFFTAVSFGDVMESDIDIECRVMASGYPKNYDREFSVIANQDSTTAQNGRDYEGLENTYVIKAGECETMIKLTIHRSEEMLNDTLVLQLELQDNKYFKLLYTDYEDNPGSYSPSVNDEFSNNHNASFHNIYMYDVVTPPKGWWKGLFGVFSVKKWRLMMSVTGTVIDDYANITAAMPMNRANAIDEAFGKYLLEMAKSRETVVLDEDGTMMYTKAVKTLGGSSAWSAGMKPESYYK